MKDDYYRFRLFETDHPFALLMIWPLKLVAHIYGWMILLQMETIWEYTVTAQFNTWRKEKSKELTNE